MRIGSIRVSKVWVGLLLAVGMMVGVGPVGVSRASAQDPAWDWTLYGQGTGAKLRFQNTGVVYGGTIGFYGVKKSGHFGLGMDARGVLLGAGDTTAGSYSDRRMDEGLLGARAQWTSGKLTPYAEGMFGLGYFRGGVGTVRQDQTSGALAGLVGLDWRVSENFDWRVAEVGYDRLKGQFGSIHPVQVSSGIVWHLP